MYQLIDSMLLILLSAVMALNGDGNVIPVIAILIAIILGAMGIYINKKEYFAVICVLFVLMCLAIPQLTFYLPIMFYHSAKYRYRWDLLGMLTFFRAAELYESWEIILWILINILAILMSDRRSRLEAAENELIRIRDTSTELNLVLKQKNKDLMEKQDYEIHLATLRERNRIAREIHDNVGHMLSRSILQVGALGTIHKEEPLHGQLVSINDTLNHAMNNIRESVHDLHDDSIDLRQSIEDATSEMKERYQLHIDYDISNTMERNIKYCFITTVKEAMSNVVKHSNATKIDIILREHPKFYQLSIEDNGTNISNEVKKRIKEEQEGAANVSGSAGIGISNMRERVESLGGTFRIQVDNGFKIFISIKKE